MPRPPAVGVGLGFGVWGYRVEGLGLREWGVDFGVWGVGFGVRGLGWTVRASSEETAAEAVGTEGLRNPRRIEAVSATFGRKSDAKIMMKHAPMAVRCLRVNVQMLNSVVDLPPTDSVSLVRTSVSSCPFELSSTSICSPLRAGHPCRSLLSPRSTAAAKPPVVAPPVCERAQSFAATGKGGANPVATCSDAAIATTGIKVRSALPAPQSCGRRAWGIVLLSADVTSS